MTDGADPFRLSDHGGGLPCLRLDPTAVRREPAAPAQTPGNLAAAHAAIRRLIGRAPAEWRGWKLGGTTHATRAAFAVQAPIFGPLHRSEILRTPRQAPGFALSDLKGEVEIALRIGPDGRGHDRWAIALEMPAASVASRPGAGVAELVADRCGAGALVLGPVHDGALPEFRGVRFGLCRGGACLSEGGIGALIDAPERLLATFVDHARALGFAPRPGDWVATGGITACCGLAVGDRVQVRVDADPVLDFVVSMRPDD